MLRSYQRRRGRITDAQRRALTQYWPRYGLEPEGRLDLGAVFGRDASRFVEVGFGMGEALVTLALEHPEHDYLGIDLYEPGVGRLLWSLAQREIPNVRVLRMDAETAFATVFADQSLDGVLMYFPDPWPKKRHHKRRLVQPPFIAQVRTTLRVGGRLTLATDWEDYAHHMLHVLEADPGLSNLAGPGRFAQRSIDRPPTRFERRGERLGHRVYDLAFERVVC